MSELARLLELLEPAWKADALCRQRDVDTMFFFPGKNDSAQAFYARCRPICWACPVRLPCLDEQLAFEGDASHHNRHGLWGGMDPRERQVEARRRLGMSA